MIRGTRKPNPFLQESLLARRDSANMSRGADVGAGRRELVGLTFQEVRGLTMLGLVGGSVGGVDLSAATWSAALAVTRRIILRTQDMSLSLWMDPSTRNTKSLPADTSTCHRAHGISVMHHQRLLARERMKIHGVLTTHVFC